MEIEAVFIVKKIRPSYWEGEEQETGKVLQTGSTKKEVVAKLISAKKNKTKITILSETGDIVKSLSRVTLHKYSKA